MVDYRKWDHIEISDDEDDTHPNIDTPSLFRWRHQARVERMEEAETEKMKLESNKIEITGKMKEIQQKLRENDTTGNVDLASLKVELSELERQQKDFQDKEEELKTKERLTPWNVDTLSKEGFSKTLINKSVPPQKVDLTDEEREAKQREFVQNNEKLVKQFGVLQKFDDSKLFLQDHPQLACEEATNYLVIWCISLAVEEKNNLVNHVAHQCICLQYIMELAKTLNVDPKACISSFFTRIQLADKQYTDAFEDELRMFKERIQERAKARIERAMQEVEEEARQERLGPGGLDPIEVIETLPEALKKCFEVQDIPLLQKVIAELPEDEARYHMKRCVDSGLWVPEGGSAEATKPTKRVIPEAKKYSQEAKKDANHDA